MLFPRLNRHLGSLYKVAVTDYVIGSVDTEPVDVRATTMYSWAGRTLRPNKLRPVVPTIPQFSWLVIAYFIPGVAVLCL